MAGRRTDAVSSYTDPGPQRQKVDFIVGEAFAGEATTTPYALYQVPLSLEAERTRRRELDSLDAAMARTGLDEGTLITLRASDTVNMPHGTVRVVPAWQWFLDRG